MSAYKHIVRIDTSFSNEGRAETGLICRTNNLGAIGPNSSICSDRLDWMDLMTRVKTPQGLAGSGRRTGKSDYVVDDQPGLLFRLVLKRHTTIFMDNMISGLTPPQFTVLAKLLEVDSTSQNYLGRLVAFDQATIKGIVDRLRKRGLVELHPDPADKRRHTVALTNKGRSLAVAAIEAGKKITKLTVEPLSAAEQKVLTRLLKKMI